MREALRTWRKRLDFLQHQEAIISDPAQKFQLAEQIEETKAKIAELEVATPGSAVAAPKTVRVDISRIVKYAPAELIGREAETRLLSDAWDKAVSRETKRPRLLTFVALGGEGKTSLVARWAAELAGQNWPGCDAAFAWSFYSQGTREQVAASSDLFLKEALSFFGDDADREFASSPSGAYEKGQRLARILGRQRSLLILDGLEPLQYAPTAPTPGQLKDQGIAALLRGLATASQGLCVVTTRHSLPDLRAFWETTAPEVKLLRLSRAAGVHLLQSFGVKGSLLRNIPFREGREQLNEFEKLVEDVQGHALTLNLLGAYLRDAHAGDIRKRDLVKLEEADDEEQGGHAFRVMESYEREFKREGNKGKRALAVLQLLGLFDRPLTSDCLGALLQVPAVPGLTEPLVDLTEAQRNLTFKRLEDARLLTVNHNPSGLLDTLDAHPLLREYFARQLREQQPDTWRAAHRRLYQYLCATTNERDKPTLEDLQPLYQAVAHGCHAGLQQEVCDKVFEARILQRNEHYSWRKLGVFGSDLGAVACFFDLPWQRLSPSLDPTKQALLLNQAALCLRALGRTAEALEPIRAGLASYVNGENWHYAAVTANNLSELELTFGDIAAALADAEKSVGYAKRSGVTDALIAACTAHAEALHQAGNRTEAGLRYSEAEKIQAKRLPRYPLLFSLWGFRYCDLLLGNSERTAWKAMLGRGGLDLPGIATSHGKTWDEVETRTTTTRGWEGSAFRDGLLESALDHLTLGRVALYREILGTVRREFVIPSAELELAVNDLRCSGNTDELPRGLLTRAWLRFVIGARCGAESAQADLDEAWEIAERGPMRLHMADIHLHRARLFFREAQYPWESAQADLAAAEKLINECGYHRRDEELADAKSAILSR